MTENMRMIIDNATATINVKFGDELPSLEDINGVAEMVRSAFAAYCPISDEEFEQVKNTLSANILHTIGTAFTLRGRDSEHKTWYFVHKNDLIVPVPD